jgi:dTDP-glucose pyrophosphorylase
VAREQSIRETIAVIDAHAKGIALVVEPDRRLVDTVTDGDVRRAMLDGVDLGAPVAVLVERGRTVSARGPSPVTAPVGTPRAELVSLMRVAKVRQLPLVDSEGRVEELALLDELLGATPSLRAVVMAGGFGRRLAPLTDDLPKPMLRVGDRPLLQRIIEQLRDAGIHHVNVTTHYRADAISEHFGDGHQFGVQIDYVPEERPLGTAGALGLLESDDPILVMNGDIFTRVDFRALHRFHDEHDADMTVAVRPYEVSVPFGLVDLDGQLIEGITEKPLLRGFVNAGLYLVNPEVCRMVPAGEPLEMPDLIRRLIGGGRRVVGFPLREYWLDIGRIEDYEQALVDAAAEQV